MKLRVVVGLFLPVWIFAQGLFDSAVDASSEKSSSINYEMNGYMRGVYFGGLQRDQDKFETKAAYGELGLKLRARKGELGDGFAELRLRRGHEFGESIEDISVREAYVNLYLGPCDLRFGEQIIVWGRADGYNPTNNLTPQNMLIRSGDEDDRRLGNFLIRTFINSQPFRLELIWVPQYTASVLPVNLLALPDYVELAGVVEPGANLNYSTIASKLHLELSAFDGSVSYIRGFMPLPGVDAKATLYADGSTSVTVMPRPYQMQMIGADFATTAGAFGLRGEVAYRDPVDDYENLIYIPNPDLQYVIGGDRTWGDFSLIVQYIGRYVIDFKPYVTGLSTDEIHLKNRMIAMQQDEISHGISFRPAFALLHETLTIEALGLVNFTTEEVYIRPKMTYQLADELTFIIGADLYAGPENTLFGSIDRALNSGFIEFKASF